MATEGHENNDKKQSRSQRRRDTENGVFEELAELLPISADMKHDKLSILRLTVAYLKLRGGLETDEQDLEECLAVANEDSMYPSLNPKPELKPPPLAMLDNDGNLIAGSLQPCPTPTNPASIALPDTVVSELEKKFLSGSKQADNTEITMLKEKFQKYKEGLEKGMQEFLNQDSSYIMFENNSSPSVDLSKGKEDTYNSTNGVRNAGTRPNTGSVGKENRRCKTYTGRDKHTTAANPSGHCDERDSSLALTNSVQEGSLSLEASTGFILSVDKDKRVLFVSENVSQFLGHCQWAVIGQDVSEFVYGKDYPELERQMSDSQFESADEREQLQPWQVRRTFYMAMKFCFQKPGSRLKDCGFQLYQWNAKLRLCKDPSTGKPRVKGLVALCCPLQRDAMMSFKDNANFFMVRFSIKDSRILYCDPKIQDLLGYTPSELIGIKHSDLKHPSDVLMCRYNYRNLPRDGKCESGYYRLLSRVGIWVWMYSHLNIVYSKDGSPEILIMKNIIVSQAEAECVLSREKADFATIKSHDCSDGLFSGRKQLPSIAAFTFEKTRKKRSILDTLSVGWKNSTDKSKSTGSPPVKTSAEKAKKCQHKMQDLVTAAPSQATEYCSRKKPHLGMEQCSSQDINMDTFQSTASNASSVSSTEHNFASTDSDSSTEFMFFQKIAQDISAVFNASSTLQTSSSEQQWTLDSLLFEDSQDNSMSCLPSNSQVAVSDSCPLEKLTGALGETDIALPSTSSNNQMIQLQTSSSGENNTSISLVDGHQISDKPDLSTQACSQLVRNDDHNMCDIIDFFDDDSSSDSSALLMPSSGNVMLSSLTAPQPIRSKQESERFICSLNKPDFQKSETKNKTFLLLDNPRSDVAPAVNSKEAVTSNICSDHSLGMDHFTVYNSVCDAPPVVSDSDIIYSPGKLDYPPLQLMPKANQVSGTVYEHYKIMNPGFTKQAVAITVPCKQNIHQKQGTPKKDIGFNTCPGNSILTFPESFVDKMLQRSDLQTEPSQEKASINRQVRENTLSDFSESVSHIFSEDICNYLIDANVSVMTTVSNPPNSENSDAVKGQPDLTDPASKLPEDLLDLVLDCDWLNS